MIDRLLEDYIDKTRKELYMSSEIEKEEFVSSFRSELNSLEMGIFNVLEDNGINTRGIYISDIIAYGIFQPILLGHKKTMELSSFQIQDLNNRNIALYQDVDNNKEKLTSSVLQVEEEFNNIGVDSNIVYEHYDETMREVLNKLSLSEFEVISQVKNTFNRSKDVVDSIFIGTSKQFINQNKDVVCTSLLEMNNALNIRSGDDNFVFLDSLYDETLAVFRENLYRDLENELTEIVDVDIHKLLPVITSEIEGSDFSKNNELIKELVVGYTKETKDRVNITKEEQAFLDDNYLDNVRSKNLVVSLEKENIMEKSLAFSEFENSLFSTYNIVDNLELSLKIMDVKDSLDQLVGIKIANTVTTLNNNRESNISFTEALVEVVDANKDLSNGDIKEMFNKSSMSTINNVSEKKLQ